MTRSTRLWFAVAALAITALLAIAAGRLASFVMRVLLVDGGKWWPHAMNGLAIGISTLTVFFCVFMAIAVKRRRARQGVRSPDPASIQDELESRKLRAGGARVQFR